MSTTTTAAAIASILDSLTLDGPEMWDYSANCRAPFVSAHSCHLAELAIIDALGVSGGSDWMPAPSPAATEIRRFLRSQECIQLSTGTVNARWLNALRAAAARIRAAA
jgi:hypothetical protein